MVETAVSSSLSARERETLREICDTLVPSLMGKPADFYGRKASDIGVDLQMTRIITEYLNPDMRSQFQRLLSILDSSFYNLLLSGTPRRFGTMSPHERERLLLNWATSRLGLKRKAFQALKKIVCFLFYSLPLENETNPNWPAIGYRAPDPKARKQYKHPEDKRIIPVKPNSDLTLECDVCVVGTGAGGSVVAATVSGYGYKVVVLESGSYFTADNFTQSEFQMTDKFYEGRGVFATDDFSVGMLAGVGGGGSTVVNWMTCMRPPRSLLDEWQEKHGVAGLLDQEFQAYVDEVWKTLRVTDAESQDNGSNAMIRKGCEALGYREDVDFFTVDRNVEGCEQRCTFCPYGCIYSAKQSTILNYLPKAYHDGARFLFNTRADRIIIHDGAAKGVEATFSEGETRFKIRIDSKMVVVAGGAVQTPALLLRSGIRSPNVGRNLHLHPTTAVIGRYDEEIRMWEGHPQTIAVDRFSDLDGDHYGVRIEAVPSHPGLSALGLPWEGGRQHKDLMSQISKAAAFIVIARDRRGGSVTIDKKGEPVVRYRLHREDEKHLIKGVQEAARIHKAAGAEEIFTLHTTPPRFVDGSDFDQFISEIERKGLAANKAALFSAHFMSSCAMGDDPRTTATSPQGEVRGVRNLFIGDTSVFPTACGVNPMITVMSMARRTAEFVASRLRSSSIPS
ncbi:MAG: GMC family oxidoreductase N-terminal domain-containing protein [Candidatus Geothermarchaeales archaeon]